MSRPSEYWSEEYAHSNGKPDANLANNALQLGGIDAEDYATKKYVQDYHNNKEKLLKEYIDSQDLAKLQEAKDYVDTMIRNQDFSSFAKLTDLQSLSATLSARIEACKTECQQEMNTKINAVVSDVNRAIDTLNTRTNELFTSVSNGKELIADAITDKGIHTSANDSYKTMATNIKNIQTEGGGEYDENFVNTADATAKASEIFLGKTAYVKGQKLYGTFVNNDTTYPTYGTDTSNADVAPEDIALGKSAYANGQYIVGTANPVSNPNVEEVYATTVNNYSIYEASARISQDPDSTNKVVERKLITFSKDGNYCVSVTKLNDLSSTETYIESYQVTENGLVINASAGENNETIYKKYRYTKAELGISNDEDILDIKFGAPGFLGYSTKCLLLIKTCKSSSQKYFLHFYTYHLNDNGVIGKEYNGENYAIQNYQVEYTDIETIGSIYNYADKLEGIIFSNNDPTVFLSIRDYDDMGMYPKIYGRKITIIPILNNGQVELNISFGAEILIWSGSGTQMHSSISKLSITQDDKYITSGAHDYNEYGIILELDNNLYFKTASFVAYSSSSSAYMVTTISNQAIYLSSEEFNLYNKNQLGNWEYSKTVNFSLEANQRIMGTALITPDNSRVIFLTSERADSSSSSIVYNSIHVYIFSLSDIINSNNGDVITPIQHSLLSSTNSYSSFGNGLNVKIASNGSGSMLYIYHDSSDYEHQVAEIWALKVSIDENNLIGLRYKNKFFRSTLSGLLSATASDVSIGKTFIGYDGTVQTGTLETTTEENLEETTT